MVSRAHLRKLLFALNAFSRPFVLKQGETSYISLQDISHLSPTSLVRLGGGGEGGDTSKPIFDLAPEDAPASLPFLLMG